MLTQVVVKLNRACNLRCRYCYYINDHTVAMGSRMTSSLLFDFLDKYHKYCMDRGIRGAVAFHGGEPLLMGKKFFQETLAHPAFSSGHLRPQLQTNGILLDEDWVALFKNHNVTIGVSLDGPADVNDAERITNSGKGSYDLVLRGIRLLQNAKKAFSLLCVVDPRADGKRVFDHFVDIGIRRMDFLPPISSHSRQTIAPIDLQGTAQYLIDAFLAWVKVGDPRIEVRLFNEMIRRYFQKTPGYAPIGMDSWGTYCVFETDGGFARIEELIDIDLIDKRSRYLTKCNIFEHDIDMVEKAVTLERIGIDRISLPTVCSSCSMNDVCNGGNIASRYDSNGSFDNPGIHCEAFFRLSGLIKLFMRYTESPSDIVDMKDAIKDILTATPPLRISQSPSVVSHTEDILSKVALARRTFSRITSALAVHWNPFPVLL